MSGVSRFSLPRKILLAATFGTALGGPALAGTVPVTGNLVPEAGAPTRPAGSVSGSFNTGTGALTYSITYQGLSGPVTAAHFHGPAKPDVSAGVLKPIQGPYDSPIKGHATFDKSQVDALEQGLVYVNLHTAANPAGEARAQLKLGQQK